MTEENKTKNHEGLFKREGSKNWYMRLRVDGRKVILSTKTSNKKIAQRILAEKRNKILLNQEGIVTIEEITFSDFVKKYLHDHCRVEKSDLKKDEYYARILSFHFGYKNLASIKPYDITKWRSDRSQDITCRGTKISKASLNRELSFLKAMFNKAIEWEYLLNNPASKIKKLKGEIERIRFLTDEEIDSLLKNCNEYLIPILITAISTGMRKSELLNQKWSEVDFKHKIIRVLKTKNYLPRNIPINERLNKVLLQMKESRGFDGYVFCKDDGSQRKSVKDAFNSSVKRSNIKGFRFHDLRHTAASLFAAGGCDIITIKNLLGHKTLAMTMKYAHLIPDSFEKAKKVMDEVWSQHEDTVWGTPSKYNNDMIGESLDITTCRSGGIGRRIRLKI